jgi:hypothetical protein
MRRLAAFLLVAGCARVPDVPYEPVNYYPGQQLLVAYDCPGARAGTQLTFHGMDGRKVDAFTTTAEEITIDRRCVRAG